MNDLIYKYENGGGNSSHNGSGNRENGGNNGNGSKKPGGIWMLIMGLVFVFMMISTYNMLFSDTPTVPEQDYTYFLNDLQSGKVESVEINTDNGRVMVTLVEEEKPKDETQDALHKLYPFLAQQKQEGADYFTLIMEDLNTLTSRLEAQGVEGKRVFSEDSGFFMSLFINLILPLLLMFLLLGFFFRKIGGSGGPMGVGKNNAKVYMQKETGVTFKDVAGEDEAKESLVEVVDFLHNPAKYSKIGAKLPKGALLVGPPGTGKTLLAKAVAGEAKVPFYSLTGSDFIELYVGVGASRVRDLFKEATKNAPCIIFIDEIDAIGRSRDSKYGGGNEEREQTLNQLLSEMDGFDTSKGILVLGATNRPEILDKALLRPGRFDRRIIVDKPDLKGRVEILKVHAKDVKMDETVDLDAIALATSGAVGSDLANMINEAAINAVKEGREFVNQQDLFAAVEQVLVGKEKKDRIMSKEERKIVSYHEVGHALISALQKNSEPVQKITIVPRTMGALGYVMHVPEEEKYLNTEAELRDMLVSLVGGRAAEEVVFDTVTTGAANDIEKATEIARSMVTRYGMSKKFGLVGLATIESQYLEGRAALNCSDETAAAIDAEIVEIIKESYEKALEMLRENRDLMDKLAEYLIEKETITGKEFMAIFRKEKGIPEPEEDKKDGAKADKADEVKAEEAGKADKSGEVKTEGAETEEAKSEVTPEAVESPEAAAESGNTESEEESKNAVEDTEESAEADEGPEAGPAEESDAQESQETSEAEGNVEKQPEENVGRFSNRRLD